MESGTLNDPSRHSPVASGCLLGRDRVQTIALSLHGWISHSGLGLGLGAQNIEALEPPFSGAVSRTDSAGVCAATGLCLREH